MIKRIQLEYARNRLFRGKALIIFGPRQAGKTTFVGQLLSDIKKKTLTLNGDDADTREIFEKPELEKIKRIIGDNEIVFIDEAQRISEIGLVIKIIIDRIKNVQVIATGSSSYGLSGSVKEPLTGRKYEIKLLPISYREMIDYHGFLTEKRQLESRLIYGSYPEIIVDPDNAKEHLKLLSDSYLYKDLFELEQIKKPAILNKIVKALALQVGSEVNFSELAQLVKADNKTVEKYIDLLEKAFVIFSLPAYSGNVRNEIKKGKKIYFFDNGIINAVTRNFNMLSNRNDIGSLWENYVISERMKLLYQDRIDAECFFWRTTQQQEIDYIEKTASRLLAVEFKWNPDSKNKIPVTFLKAYPEAKTMLVSREERDEFLTV
jgi:uncharacterized protein